MGTETKPDLEPLEFVAPRALRLEHCFPAALRDAPLPLVVRIEPGDRVVFNTHSHYGDDMGSAHLSGYTCNDGGLRGCHVGAADVPRIHAELVALRDGGPERKFKVGDRGKKARAEPVAALYEQGKVHHVGNPNCKRCGTDECELDRNGECWMCWQEQDERQRVDAAVSRKLAPQPDPYAANQSDHDKTSTIGDEWPLERAQAAHNWLLSAAIALHEAVTGGDLHLPGADPPNALSECPKAMRPLLAQIEKLLRRLDQQ